MSENKGLASITPRHRLCGVNGAETSFAVVPTENSNLTVDHRHDCRILRCESENSLSRDRLE